MKKVADATILRVSGLRKPAPVGYPIVGIIWSMKKRLVSSYQSEWLSENVKS